MSTSLSELGLQLAHTQCALCMLSVSEFICTLVLVSIEGLLFLVSPFPLALTALMPPLLPGSLTCDGRELMKRISYVALRVPRSPTLWTLSSCGNIIPSLLQEKASLMVTEQDSYAKGGSIWKDGNGGAVAACSSSSQSSSQTSLPLPWTHPLRFLLFLSCRWESWMVLSAVSWHLSIWIVFQIKISVVQNGVRLKKISPTISASSAELTTLTRCFYFKRFFFIFHTNHRSPSLPSSCSQLSPTEPPPSTPQKG